MQKDGDGQFPICQYQYIYGQGHIQDALHIDIYICKNVFSILVDNSYEMMGRFLQN